MIAARFTQRFCGFELQVDFASPGPVLGVFGRSGSGKTTLLHCLAGLLRPPGAEIAVGGATLASARRQLPPERRGLALVPQQALLFPHLSVRGNLTHAPGSAAELQTQRGRQITEVLRLGPLLQRRVATLSGGERQRVALGRALLARPRMLLLDEPAASLDAELQREVLALLQQARDELRLSMLFVTHRPADLLALADDCIVLDGGRLIAQGPPLRLLAAPAAGGLADLQGLDNLLRLPVAWHDESLGVTAVDLGLGALLRVPWDTAPIGSRVVIGIRAEDVILCRQTPAATSARNALAGLVAALDAVGREVLVTVRVGATMLRVRITAGAARELQLQPGGDVVLLIKSTACHRLGDAG